MCKRSGESVDHLFLHCSVAMELWSMVFGMFGVHWVMPCTVMDLFCTWLGQRGQHSSLVFWKMIPHCLVWCIWAERNSRHFEDSERSIPELKLFFSHILFDWVMGLGAFSIHSVSELIDLCTL